MAEERIATLIPSLIIPILFLGYATFIFVKGGVHVRGKGWKTKDEAPKTYYFMIIFMVILGVAGIATTILKLVL
jgi:hypothetical protein|tara:strand:- start:4263 stop:4484 length:222 start_codon:yes stop_codon:yes gene_type:complete